MEQNSASQPVSNIATLHDGSRTCDCIKCVKRDPARFNGNANGDPVTMRFGRLTRTVHLTSRSCGTYAFCGADVGHGLGSATGAVDAIRRVRFCKKCVNPDALAITYGLIAFVAFARSRKPVLVGGVRGTVVRIVDKAGVEHVGRICAGVDAQYRLVESAHPELIEGLRESAAKESLGLSVIMYTGTEPGDPSHSHSVTVTGAKLIEAA